MGDLRGYLREINECLYRIDLTIKDARHIQKLKKEPAEDILKWVLDRIEKYLIGEKPLA